MQFELRQRNIKLSNIMTNFYKSLWTKGALPLLACTLITGCVDDKYDLTDIDTTSRFTVDNLTVPVNLSEILLDKVVNLDDNENITTIDGKYAIQRGGNFKSNSIYVSTVTPPSIAINPSLLDINLAGTGVVLPQYKDEVDLPNMPESDYHINLENIDKSIISISSLKTINPIEVKIQLSVPPSILANGSSAEFRDLRFRLPWGLISENPNYDSLTGILYVEEIPVGADGYANFIFNASGIEFTGDRGMVKNNQLLISDKVALDSGKINLDLNNVAVPSVLKVEAKYSVSSFTIKSFSGEIDYKMDKINVAPISLSGLPEFLDSPDSKIYIANPTITIDINNPVAKYGLEGSGEIKLTSEFSKGNTTLAQSDPFFIGAGEENTNILFDKYNFANLGGILANDNVGGLPSTINVNLENICFKGHAVDFPLGENIPDASGNYQFTAPLGFDKGSVVIYETTENGWGSEDLDKLNINLLKVRAMCTTNIPVSVVLSAVPIDKYGKDIPVKEPAKLEVTPYASGSEIYLEMEGANGPINNLDGIRFIATIRQDNPSNTEAIGPDQFIMLDDVRATVDGYYETDF